MVTLILTKVMKKIENIVNKYVISSYYWNELIQKKPSNEIILIQSKAVSLSYTNDYFGSDFIFSSLKIYHNDLNILSVLFFSIKR